MMETKWTKLTINQIQISTKTNNRLISNFRPPNFCFWIYPRLPPLHHLFEGFRFRWKLHSDLKHLITHYAIFRSFSFFFIVQLLSCGLFCMQRKATDKLKLNICCVICYWTPNAGPFFFFHFIREQCNSTFPPNTFNADANANTNFCLLNAIEIEMWCNRTYDWVQKPRSIPF